MSRMTDETRLTGERANDENISTMRKTLGSEPYQKLFCFVIFLLVGREGGDWLKCYNKNSNLNNGSPHRFKTTAHSTLFFIRMYFITEYRG